MIKYELMEFKTRNIKTLEEDVNKIQSFFLNQLLNNLLLRAY